MPKYAIVCVDDEMVVLEGLNAQLEREFGKDFIIEMALSGEEAVDIVNEFIAEDIEVPVLITDQKMPGMKGSELLLKIKDISSNTHSILLTGQAGADEVGDALNRANLYRYMAKPWDRTDLIMTVQEAVNSYKQKNEIRDKTERLKEYSEKLEEMVKSRTLQLEEEKEKSDILLLNILPAQTAAELKKDGISPPRHYDRVTILFTDFVGFSSYASEISPAQLVDSLGEAFNAFDDIVVKHKLEKIKTIGDSYMAVGGIPQKNETNALDAVSAAVQMRDWVEKWNLHRQAASLPCWEMRVGIHSGELVAGVIGTMKFAYDVWGDAVNIASRMETNSIAGKINISHSTYELVKDDFACEIRGEIEVKNRGKFKMYFVEPR